MDLGAYLTKLASPMIVQLELDEVLLSRWQDFLQNREVVLLPS
jgi:hypothetical protein